MRSAVHITSTETVAPTAVKGVATSLQTEGERMAAVLALQLGKLIDQSGDLNGKDDQFISKFGQAAEVIDAIRQQTNVSNPMLNQCRTIFGKIRKLVTGGRKDKLTRAMRESFYRDDSAEEDERFSIG